MPRWQRQIQCLAMQDWIKDLIEFSSQTAILVNNKRISNPNPWKIWIFQSSKSNPIQLWSPHMRSCGALGIGVTGSLGNGTLCNVPPLFHAPTLLLFVGGTWGSTRTGGSGPFHPVSLCCSHLLLAWFCKTLSRLIGLGDEGGGMFIETRLGMVASLISPGSTSSGEEALSDKHK